MAAFLSVGSPTRVGRDIAPKLLPGFSWKGLSSKMGIEIGPDPQYTENTVSAELLTGKDAGTIINTVAANQRAVLKLGTIAPLKYTAVVVVNPEFNLNATVTGPGIVEPKWITDLNLYITAHRVVDLEALDWYCRIYLFE